MLVQTFRSLVFYALYFLQTAVLAIVAGLVAVIWRRNTALGWAVGKFWSHSNLFLLRWVVGIRTEITGHETIPAGPAIIAAKHMSDWDIFAILPNCGRPAFIAKKELIDIPFFGWAAQSIDTIKIDRAKGAQAIPAMMREARSALARGCRIIIFPEGTRRAPLAPPRYRQGLVRMYEELGVPVIPVALNSGLYWGRNSWVLWPGTARAKFLPAIPPGLSGAEFEARLVETIETATDALILEDVRKGLSRPIGGELGQAIAALQARSGESSSSAH